jgi:uracil-DNA glycosylase
MDLSPRQLEAFRRLASDLPGIDRAVYAEYGRDPLEPVLGLGDPATRIAFFGRDPGRDEVRHGMPFIGAGGQKVRAVLHEHRYGSPLPGFEAAVEVGRHYFWINTVPYKPVGNKAWSTRVKRAFQPLVAELLCAWPGEDVITLGREAFLWFALEQPPAVGAALHAFWASPDRFETACVTEVRWPGGGRRFRLHPLPHPSPLNATWYRRFPELLRARLRGLDSANSVI